MAYPQTASSVATLPQSGQRSRTMRPRVRAPQSSSDEAVMQEIEQVSLRACGDFIDFLMGKKD